MLEHLERYHEQLAQRPEYKQGRVPWFALSRYASDYYQEFDKAKIIYPAIAMSRRFAFDKSGYYLNDKAFCIPLDDYSLLGILNSKCCWSWIKEKCPGHGDPNNRGRFELRDEKMRNLPIPQPNPEQRARIEELAKKLVEYGPDTSEAVAWEAEIDQIVCQMFDLTSEEIAEVERQAKLGPGKRKQRTATEEVDGA